MMSDWKRQRERSNRFWIAVLVWIARALGRGPVRLLLYPITLYFYLTGTEARSASRHSLRRVFEREPSRREVFRHLYTFSRVTSDRLFLLTEAGRYQIDAEGDAAFMAAMSGGRGCLLMVSHLGCFDALRVMGVRGRDLPLRIVFDRRQTPMVGDVLDQLDPQLAAGVIPADCSGPELVLAIEKSLARGELVGLMADRAGPRERVLHADLLGDDAPLPLGPWQLALVLKVPVILCFGIYLGGNRYRMCFEVMSEGLSAQRSQRDQELSRCVAHYAERLQHYARLAPYNWFNFYDFWGDERAAGDAGVTAEIDPGDPASGGGSLG